MNDAEMNRVYYRLRGIARRKRRPLTFHEACDFISAMSGLDIDAVKLRLVEANRGDVDDDPNRTEA